MVYRVTTGAGSSKDGSKPVVIYEATQHAREWISTEIERRLFQYVLAHANDQGTAIPQLLRDTELWFIPVMNPDGYDYTYLSPANRLWRRNLADNDGDNQLTGLDGVDPNRNWAYKWRYDQEGADDTFGSDTYRGKSPESEPEVSGAEALFARLKPNYQLDYHSFAQLILWPEGWQVATDATDAPAMKALAGTQSDPAVAGFTPEVSAQLYTTNGDVTGDTYNKYGTQAYTVELDGGTGDPIGGTDGEDYAAPGGFVFQDRERDVQAESNKNRDFALDLAKSAPDPAHPVSHLGNTAPDFVPHTFTSPTASRRPSRSTRSATSATSKVNWRVNGGPTKSNPTTEYEGGTRYGGPGKYYHRLRGEVTGFQPGDHVEVWFTAGRASSSSFTFSPVVTNAKDVLVMAAEDYSGPSSVTGAGPHEGPQYLDYYRDALQRNGLKADVYDVDGAGRVAPDYLGVLSHYKSVIWYTGDDLYVREPGEPGGTGNSKLMQDEVTNARDYLNDGGRLLVTGQNALQGGWDEFLYNPLGSPPNSYCKSNNTQPAPADDIPPGQSDTCVKVSNDFIQYYLGGWIKIIAADTPEKVAALPFERAGGVFGSSPFGVNGANSADNQQTISTLVPTSDILKPSDFPQFKSTESIKFDRAPRVRPDVGHALRVRAVLGRELSAPARARSTSRRRHHRGPEVQDLLRHGEHVRLRVRGGAHGRPGRLDDAARQERQHHRRCRQLVRHRLEHAAPVPEPLPVQPHAGLRLHRRRARPGTGTRPPATPAASRTGTSTSRPTRASRSRSRSPTRRTSGRRASARSSTTSRCSRTAPWPRRRTSRTASPHGSPVRSPRARPTRRRGSTRRPWASPTAPASRPTRRSCGASASRPSARRPTGRRCSATRCTTWPTRSSRCRARASRPSRAWSRSRHPLRPLRRRSPRGPRRLPPPCRGCWWRAATRSTARAA